uniref:Uncharacterized protein n=1 Tax=Phenylobacterium glaciei TaxID=2803784 RepID=A0A974P3R4_9CAUL|nr:hypothetical protein JKL49_27060 [Phenylobacterium glaciei]
MYAGGRAALGLYLRAAARPQAEPQIFRDHFETLARHPGHWPCISFCNHDIMRTATRFGAARPSHG